MKFFIHHILYSLCWLALFQSCVSYKESEYIVKTRFDEAVKKHVSGDFKNAITLYENILKSYPDTNLKENILLNLADAHLAIGNYKYSLSIWNDLVKNTINPYILGVIHFKLANFYFSSNNLIEAKKYIIEALKYPSQYYSLYIALQMAAKICYMLHDTDNAKYYFLQLTTNFPDDPYAQKVSAIIELLESGNFYLQLGKFSSLENANNLAAKLNMSGYSTIIKSINTNNNNFYLVLSPCKTIENCKKTKEKLNKLDIDAIEVP